MQAAPELAERSFGSLDFSSDSNYGGVWLEDTRTSSFRPAGGESACQWLMVLMVQLKDVLVWALHHPFRPPCGSCCTGGGESVQDVVDRLGQLLKRLEEAHQVGCAHSPAPLQIVGTCARLSFCTCNRGPWDLSKEIGMSHQLDVQGCTILLVSHGDTLSIFWSYATGTGLLENRRHGLNTGELRKLSGSLGSAHNAFCAAEC